MASASAASAHHDDDHDALQVGSTFCFIKNCPVKANKCYKGRCPMKDSKCHKASFKKAEIWGVDEHVCLAQLRKQYTNSSMHFNDFGDGAAPRPNRE